MIDGALGDAQQVRQRRLAPEHLADHQVALNCLAPLAQADVLFRHNHGWHANAKAEIVSRKKYASAEDSYKSALGARIRSVRGENSQEWLAKILGVSTSRVSEWEGGKKEPRAGTLTKVAAATGCDLAWLVRGDYPIRHLTTQAAAEVPSPWPIIPRELEGDRRLEKAAQDLIYLLQHGDAEELAAILKNIEVFARDTRARLEPKRRRRAG